MQDRWPPDPSPGHQQPQRSKRATPILLAILAGAAALALLLAVTLGESPPA